MKKNAYTFDQLTDEAKQNAFTSNEATWWKDQDINEALQEIAWAVEYVNDSVGGVTLNYDQVGELASVSAVSADFFVVIESIGMQAEGYSGATGYSSTIADAYNSFMSGKAQELEGLMEALEDAEAASQNCPMGTPDFNIYNVIEIQTAISDIFDQARAKAAQAANEAIEAARNMYEFMSEAEGLLSYFYWSKDGEYIEAI